MKTILYEMRAEHYECTKISDDGSDIVKIIFETPIDGKISISDHLYPLARGIASLCISDICDGEINPLLYSGGKIYKLEGFMAKSGALIPLMPNGEYIKRLGGICEQMNRKITLLEEEISALKTKISAPLEF